MVNIGQRLCFFVVALDASPKNTKWRSIFQQDTGGDTGQLAPKKTMFPSIDEQLSVGA